MEGEHEEGSKPIDYKTRTSWTLCGVALGRNTSAALDR
jgi:hypothetical protein